ncbi:MAG: methyltransferase domain-containing protein [Chitinophagaceae bacterium]|nr:MAG: methyltransferase domain-containing protein [Chitinophagaceae bacterium]
MSLVNENLITAEEVMRRIRSRLGMEQVSVSSVTAASPQSASAAFLPRVLRLRASIGVKQAYVVGELLIYDDVDFISNAYQALFRRAPDEAAMGFVNALRQGSLTKVEVLGQLRFSQEGMRHGVHVDGLLFPYKLRTWRRKHYVGPVLGWLISLGQLGRLFDRQASHMAMASAEIQGCRDAANTLAEQVEERLLSIEAAISQLPSSATVHQLRSELDLHFERISLLEALVEKHQERLNDASDKGDQLRSELGSQSERIAQLEADAEKHQERLNDASDKGDQLRSELGLHSDRISQLEADVEESSAQLNGLLSNRNYDDRGLDPLYAAFEDQFRGSRDLIRQRIAPYLDFVESVGAGKPTTPIFDLGCGRGEWLQLLRDRGYTARGVELNRVFIDACRGRGLEVIDGDAIATLRTLQDNSVGVVSLMHLAEHLSFIDLIALIDEALRVLIPGGGLIIETPNPENALVSRWAFYMDPTHRNPLPPDMLRWMVEARGFMFVEIARLFEGRPVDVADYLQDDIPGALVVNELLAPSHASLDYAILARKPAAA